MFWAAIAKAVGNGVSAGTSMYNSIEAGKANAQATAMEAAATANEMRMNGAILNANQQINAFNYDTLADYYLEQAGGFQLQGRQEREQIGLALGQTKGDIVASAAGSGISVDSRVVEKTISDSKTSAYHDLETSAANEYANVLGAQKNAKIAQTNAKNARAIGSWAADAYSSLATSTENAGALLANTQLKAGYNSAIATGIGYLVDPLGAL